jgi:hypothetical protein
LLPKLSESDRSFIASAEKVSRKRREMLQQRYEEANGGGGGDDDNDDSNAKFDDDLYCLLTSYASLTGERRQGEGYQAAITPHTFDVLNDVCGASAECFASPLNRTCDSYWSAFPQIDTLFGR